MNARVSLRFQVPNLWVSRSERLLALAAYEAIACCPLLVARFACRLPLPMLLLLTLILHWATMMYDDFNAVILHVDNICDFLRMVLDDRFGWSAVDLLVKIIYVLSNRTRLRHLPGSISLTVGF